MAEVGFGLDHCRQGRGSGAFGGRVFSCSNMAKQDGAGDFLVVDGDDFIDVAIDEGRVRSPARRTAMPSAIVASAEMVTG